MKIKILLGFLIILIAVIETSAVVHYVKENPNERAYGFSWVNEYQPAPGAGGIVYVKKGGAGDGKGSSWANAYPELADALLAAKTETDIKEIWVAAGTYNPLYPADDTSPDQHQKAFVLVEGVKIYGGFPADANDAIHTSISTRGSNPLQNATILSGDLDGNDTDDLTVNRSDNVYHVVIGAKIADDGKTILDGFTITGGNTATVTGYDITVNEQTVNGRAGGGICNYASFPTLTNLTISGNTAYVGGGIANYYSSPTLTNLTVSKNAASYSGGGIYNETSPPTLTNLTISGNTAVWYGGGICNRESSLKLTNVIISGNTATEGGGIFNTSHSSPQLTNVTISGNTATEGGGIYNYTASSPTLYNTIVWGNGTSNNYTYSSSSPIYKYSLVQGVTTEDAVGNLNGGVDPLFVSPVVEPAPTTTGNYRLQATSLVIDAGNNSLYTQTSGHTPSSDVDLDGKPRLYGPSIDLGAYEYQTVSGSILYVKQNGTGDGSGSSWANASSELAEALHIAETNPAIQQIWVATGTYKPLYPADGTSVDPRDRAFVLREGLKIYGGFPADANDGSHTALSRRGSTPLLNATILNGDNAYHVVIGANIAPDGETVLDGFTITGGNADSGSTILVNEKIITHNSGGGIYNEASSPTLTNLTISGNTASDNGGGIYNAASSPRLTNLTISGNTAVGRGGGIFNNSSSPTLTNLTISGNMASNGGGGIVNDSSFPTLTNLIISGNTASNYGGGIVNDNHSSPKLTNVTISGNAASNDGGGMSNYTYSSPILTNVTISGNTASNGIGGGIYNYSSSSPTLTNSIVWGNTASSTVNNVYSHDTTPTYNYSLVQGATTQDANGNLDGSLDPLFVDWIDPSDANWTATIGGHYRLSVASPLIDAGNNISYTTASGRTLSSDVDIDGNSRLYGPSIDLGAYEFSVLIWTGIAGGNNWSAPGNWKLGKVPDGTSSVYIPGSLNSYPVLKAADLAVVKDIRFAPGAEIGRQQFLSYEKAYVQLDFSASESRDRWHTLSSPLQELYAGDFSFSGYPGMDMKLFEIDQEQGYKAVWKRITTLAQSFSVGDGFIVWLAHNKAGDTRGLALSKGVLELPYFDNPNVSAAVHWTHHYTAHTSTFGGWKEDGASIVATETGVTAERNLDKAYRLAGQIVNKSLNFGQDIFAIAGNPYMSSINFTALYNANKSFIGSTYQIWIGAGGGSGGSYAGYNASINKPFGREGVNLNRYIAPMQSFIVQKSGASASGTLAFDLENIYATGLSARLRSTNPSVDNLDIVASTAQAGVRTVIASRQEGGYSFGPADSHKLFDEINSNPEVYMLKPGANNEQVATAVNVLGEITGETLVPLVIATNHNGEISFAFSGMDTYNARIFLLDTETNKEIELTDKSQYEYKFDYVPEQSGGKIVANENRFFIRLNKVSSDIETIASETVRIYASRPGTLQVVSTHPLRQVMVYNLQGSMVYNEQVRTSTHKIESLAVGVYIVKVVSGNTVKIEKVIVR